MSLLAPYLYLDKLTLLFISLSQYKYTFLVLVLFFLFFSVQCKSDHDEGNRALTVSRYQVLLLS